MEKGFIFQIKRGVRRLTLRLNAQGQPVVTAPAGVSRLAAAHLVAKNQAWIAAQLKRQQRLTPLITKQTILLFGQNYQKISQALPQRLPGFYILEEKLIYNPTDSQNPNKFQAIQLKRFLKLTATQYIIKRAQQLATKMALNPKTIGLREQSSRWGSCSSRGHLSFNWRLVHFSPAIIDYVIIHELAHLQQANHSSKFWQLVKQYDPKYQQHRQELKKYLLNNE